MLFIFLSFITMNKITSLLLLFGYSVFAQVPPSQDNKADAYEESPILISDYKSSDPDTPVVFSGQSKKWGVKLSGNDSVIIKQEYDYISHTDNAFILKKGNKFGIASLQAALVLPIEYDSVTTNQVYNNTASFFVKKNDKWGAVDVNGKQILPLKFFKILYSDPVNGISIVKESKDGPEVVFLGDKKYHKELLRMSIFSNGAIASSGGKSGLLSYGKQALPFEYDSIYTGNSGNAWTKKYKKNFITYGQPLFNMIVIKNGRYGLCDVAGTMLFEPVYDKITYDSMRRLYIISKDKKEGVYFERSKAKTAVAYDQVYNDGAQFVTLINNKKQGIIDYQGNWILPMEYDKATVMGFNDGFLVVKDGKKGWADNKGLMVLPIIYDDIDTFPFKFKGLYIVTQNDKKGIVNRNHIIIPVEFDYLYDRENYIIGCRDKKFGVFSPDGTLVSGVDNDRIVRSETGGVNVLYPVKDGLYGIIGKNNDVLYTPQFKDISYLPNSKLLVSPIAWDKSYRLVKDKNNKYGLFEEHDAVMAVPVAYDGIYQKFQAPEDCYFVAKKGLKFGIINGENKIVVPFVYDSLNLNHSNYVEDEKLMQLVAVKNKKFGVINFMNQVLVPFEYDEVAKLTSDDALYKAKKKGQYRLINGAGKVLNSGPFDEIASFEGDEALAFYKGKMRIINSLGAFISEPVEMLPHKGFATFDDMKWALVKALNATDDAVLRDFAVKALPSDHIFYFMKENILSKKPLETLETNTEFFIDRLYEELRQFKISDWNSPDYDKRALTDVPDFTLEREGYITNVRNDEWNYGNGRFMQRVLRNAVKINGYWISTYFLQTRFY